MENSINSSISETHVSHLKSIFKKPTDIYQAFQVSLEESVSAAQSNTSEPDLDTSAGTQTSLPFKKSRKSVQKHFNISLSDSLVDSEVEQSVTSVNPQPVFSKKNKSLIDFFNVSFDETNANLQSDVLSKSVDDSNVAFSKANPFNKHVSENNGVVGNISPMHVSGDEKSESSVESQRHSPYDIDGDEDDLTTFRTKQNPFKKPSEKSNDSSTQLHLSITNDKSCNINSSELDNKSNSNNSVLNNKTDSSTVKNKSDQFLQKKSLQNRNSVPEEINSRSLENATLTDLKLSSANVSLDKTVSKTSNSRASYLEQSSINDENLNDWMSDHSDEEMPLPRISPVTTNLSPAKEKPAAPVSPTVATNSLSVWEQKLLEIVSNAEKKSQKTTSQKSLIPSPKPKPKSVKKPVVNEKESSENSNKYRPPKLIKPAPFATKKFYDYIIKRLEPKYGINKMIESENLVLSICDTVKKVTRRKTHQKRLIQNLKKEMAIAGLITTTMDFYEFVIRFLPYSFRVKVVPCLQPVTNLVYPPKDAVSPFDKIL